MLEKKKHLFNKRRVIIFQKIRYFNTNNKDTSEAQTLLLKTANEFASEAPGAVSLRKHPADLSNGKWIHQKQMLHHLHQL